MPSCLRGLFRGDEGCVLLPRKCYTQASGALNVLQSVLWRGWVAHSWEFFTGGASDVAQRRAWRGLSAPLAWKEEGCRLAEAFKWGPSSDDTLQSD